jgi:predicted nucleic acid-binding Zn ribbon protein
LNIELPVDGRIERKVCVVCAADVRRFVLEQPDSRHLTEVIIDERQRPRTTARIGWFLVRAVAYIGIAAGVFALVTWLTSL